MTCFSKKTSDLLLEFLQSLNKKSISLNEISLQLGKRGLALCNLLFALPSAIPLGLPIISSLTGAIIMIVSLQIIICSNKLYLPSFIGKYQFSLRLFRESIHYALPLLKYIERFTTPRWGWFIHIIESFSGFVIFILGFILFLPIPFLNLPSALCICALSIGFLEKDGLIVFFILSVIIVIFIMKYHLILAGLNWIYAQ